MADSQAHEADVVVVGAGLAGLVAACDLLGEGRSVVCEGRHEEQPLQTAGAGTSG